MSTRTGLYSAMRTVDSRQTRSSRCLSFSSDSLLWCGCTYYKEILRTRARLNQPRWAPVQSITPNPYHVAGLKTRNWMALCIRGLTQSQQFMLIILRISNKFPLFVAKRKRNMHCTNEHTNDSGRRLGSLFLQICSLLGIELA